MDTELKPCPFCGSAAELKETHYLESEKPYSYVHCTNSKCTLYLNTTHFSGTNEQHNSELAVQAWNSGKVGAPTGAQAARAADGMRYT